MILVYQSWMSLLEVTEEAKIEPLQLKQAEQIEKISWTEAKIY